MVHYLGLMLAIMQNNDLASSKFNNTLISGTCHLYHCYDRIMIVV